MAVGSFFITAPKHRKQSRPLYTKKLKIIQRQIAEIVCGYQMVKCSANNAKWIIQSDGLSNPSNSGYYLAKIKKIATRLVTWCLFLANGCSSAVHFFPVPQRKWCAYAIWRPSSIALDRYLAVPRLLLALLWLSRFCAKLFCMRAHQMFIACPDLFLHYEWPAEVRLLMERESNTDSCPLAILPTKPIVILIRGLNAVSWLGYCVSREILAPRLVNQ